MKSLIFITFGLLFLMVSAGAVDGTADAKWVAIYGAIGIVFMVLGVKFQEEE